ncbi:Butyrophilin-like protein 10 [Labeo rohita]|uniref:Butyrophilin-like protein 10 n=1 Tax=Labeo rohita TaxID=84645 RepID=A0ABQ8L032_LABRO|nr:Butyrophilin-like protein 10 [Labeo rohita]
MRVEWFRPDLKDSLVHLYENHEDRNTDQIQSYRERTKLNHQELQRGNASLKLSSVQVSDEGRWYPEPDLEWLNSEGVSLSSEKTEMQRNTDGFSVKHTITVHHREDKIHCRVKLRHHVLETLIVTSSKSFNPWRTSIILSSITFVLILIAGILIYVFDHKYRGTFFS